MADPASNRPTPRAAAVTARSTFLFRQMANGGPLLRCAETARMIGCARGRRVEAVDALREMDVGEFDGRSYEEIAAYYPDLYRQWMEHQPKHGFPAASGLQKRQNASRAPRARCSRDTMETRSLL